MDEALVVGAGLIHAAVRNGEEIFKIEGELVVINGNRLFFCLDLQAVCRDLYTLADLCQVFIFVIDQCKGCTDTHGGASSADTAGSDRDLGFLHSLDNHIAAVYHGAVQDLGTALSVSLHHGHGTCKTHAASLAAHCAREGLGCQKTRKPAVQILSEDGVRCDTVGGTEVAGKLNVSLIVVDTDCRTHGKNICVDKGINGLRNACAGGVGAVVCAIFHSGVNALRGEAAADPGIGPVGSDIDTHSRGNVHSGAGETGQILKASTGFLQSVVRGLVIHSWIGRQVQTQHAQHHGHQGAVAHAAGSRAILGRGDIIELAHNLVADDAGGGVVGEIGDTKEGSDFLEVAVKARAVGQGEGLGLILVQSFRINNDTPSYVSLPVKVGTYIGSGEIDGNGSSHSGGFAGGKA